MLQPQAVVRNALTTGRESVKVFLTDVGHGLLDVSHSMLAMVGLAVVAGALFMSSQDDLRDSLEARAWGWLEARHLARSGGEDLAAQAEAEPTSAGVVNTSSTADPADLTRAQANVARWIVRRYHVAPEPVARLVQESWTVGQRTGIEPTLITYMEMARNGGMGQIDDAFITQQGEAWQPLFSPFKVLDRPHLRKLQTAEAAGLLTS